MGITTAQNFLGIKRSNVRFGQKQMRRPGCRMSAFVRITDSSGTSRDVRLGVADEAPWPFFPMGDEVPHISSHAMYLIDRAIVQAVLRWTVNPSANSFALRS